MTTHLSKNELPSVKFEKEIKDLMNYSKLEILSKNQSEFDEIDSWIHTFQSNVEAYLTNSSDKLSLNNSRRCKHFNYIINTIINKVNSLSIHLPKKSELSKLIKEYRNKFFLSNNNLKCNEDYKYSSENEIILGTFCEDRDFINRNLDQIQNSDHCQNIVDYMSTIKVRLLSIHQLHLTRRHTHLEIDNNCSTKNLNDILPSITCNSGVKHSSQSDPLSQSVNHADGDESSQELMTQNAPEHARLTTDSQELVTITGESEPSDGQSSNTLNTVGLPIFGVLGCSFLFYKFTPVGSIFRSRIQNKGFIPINKDDYSPKQILSNEPNTNDISSENAQYKISYQTL